MAVVVRGFKEDNHTGHMIYCIIYNSHQGDKYTLKTRNPAQGLDHGNNLHEFQLKT